MYNTYTNAYVQATPIAHRRGTLRDAVSSHFFGEKKNLWRVEVQILINRRSRNKFRTILNIPLFLSPTPPRQTYQQSHNSSPITTMSREAYAPPTLQPQGSAYGAASAELAGPTTQYLCGSCNSKVQLKKGDPIRCKDCGHRVLYKERTKRYVNDVWRSRRWCWGGG